MLELTDKRKRAIEATYRRDKVTLAKQGFRYWCSTPWPGGEPMDKALKFYTSVNSGFVRLPFPASAIFMWGFRTPQARSTFKTTLVHLDTKDVE